MPRKTIIIFITVFAIVGAIVLGFYLLSKKQTAPGTTGGTSWYQTFNPFGGGGGVTTPVVTPEVPGIQPGGQGAVGVTSSKFFQITDFAVAGATFLEDIRLKEINPNAETIQQPEPIKTIIDANTKEGRKEIQKFLNDTLSLNPPLTLDGNFGKKAIEAIISFQKLNKLATTGKIDAKTAPFFTKTIIPTTNQIAVNPYETVPSLRYVERLNGHIYKMFLDTKSKEKISNSTIPSIYEAYFDKTGQTVIYRYLSNDNIISSYLATLSTANGEFLPQNISNLSLSIDKNKFFYLTENSNGVTGTIGEFGSTKKDLVFTSPFTEWLSSWDNNQKIYLTSKPSYGVLGSMFILNPNTKTTTKILGGVAGLTTLVNNDGTATLYGTSTSGGPKIGVYNITNNTSKDFKTYSLPEKCVWSIDNINVYCAIPNTIIGNQFPDSWYQGLVSFDDYFVKIDTTTGSIETLANSANETSIDGTYLFLDDTESNLFFINKKDSTLWGLKLK